MPLNLSLDFFFSFLLGWGLGLIKAVLYAVKRTLAYAGDLVKYNDYGVERPVYFLA
jgi:hypothetical protein